MIIVKPVGSHTHRIEFVMPHYAHTEYHGKHNHRGRVAHRFLVELSYAKESAKKTPLTELAQLISYAEVYAIENHTVSLGHSSTHVDQSKVVLYLPVKNAKRAQQLLFELRYHIGIIHTGEREGSKGHVFFNTSVVQDYVAEE